MAGNVPPQIFGPMGQLVVLSADQRVCTWEPTDCSTTQMLFLVPTKPSALLHSSTVVYIHTAVYYIVFKKSGRGSTLFTMVHVTR